MWLGFVNFVLFLIISWAHIIYYLFFLSLEPCVLCVCVYVFCFRVLVFLLSCLAVAFFLPEFLCASLLVTLPSLSHVCFIVDCVGLSGDPATSPLPPPPFLFCLVRPVCRCSALWPEFEVESSLSHSPVSSFRSDHGRAQ